ncbi:SAC3 family protein LENG8/THP3, partial [Phenoliferia sp. Uapishka_3]
MASSSWPPALKTYVNETFAKCTDANRSAVESELKGLIFEAFEADKLWKIDWANIKLKALNPPKKRKAFVPSTPHAYGVTHAVVADETDRRDKRARRFENGPPPHTGSVTGAGGLAGRMAGRVVQAGIGSMYGASTPEPEGIYDPNVIDWDRETVVGTSKKLEKPFLRLTTVPDPTTIRPLPILQQTLELLKNKWRDEGNYPFICDQFKSMRQDLTVQRIKNDFTCSVYEIHARIALEKGDLGEFNQCQGQLWELYKHGLKGHSMEFLGYRILYLLFSRNRAELNATMAALTPEETSNKSVVHALSVRQALSTGNYTKFFRLWEATPMMGAYLMDHIAPRERISALMIMAKAYKTGFPLSLVLSQLAFSSPEEAVQFLIEHNISIYKVAPGAKQPTPPLPTSTLQSDVIAPRLAEALAKFTKADAKRQL